MIDLVTFSVKKGDDLWEATVKVRGDQKSVSAVAKMLSALTYIIRANPPEDEPEVDTGLSDMFMEYVREMAKCHSCGADMNGKKLSMTEVALTCPKCGAHRTLEVT